MTAYYYARVYVLTLQTRPERLDAFFARLPKPFPFAQPCPFYGTNGNFCKPPAWWKPTEGAWGAYRSHLNILESALNEQAESILIFEDDAVFCEDFAAKCEELYERVPEDWSSIYLGGEHLQRTIRPPRRVVPGIVEPYDVNRLHAWSIRGQRAMLLAYQTLCSPQGWKSTHHIDHRLGQFWRTSGFKAYCPVPWLVGQGSGRSDVTAGNPELPERFFQ